jgi:WD40 repeat protein
VDTPTKIERDNPNDPDNPEFPLTTPAIKLKYTKKGHIIIDWENAENNFATSFVLLKSVNGDENFSILDTVSVENSSYTDSSKHLTTKTIYNVQALRQLDDTLIVADSNSQKVNFTGFAHVNVDIVNQSNAFKFSWNTKMSWPFLIVFEVYETGDKDSVISSLNTFNFSNYPNRYLERTISMYLYLVNEKKDQLVDSSQMIFDRRMDDMPTFTNVEIKHEEEVKISWCDNSDIEQGYKIFRSYNHPSNYVEIANVPPNTTTFVDSLQPFGEGVQDHFSKNYSYKTFYAIYAYKDSTLSAAESKKLNITVTPPEIVDYSTSETAVSFRWKVPQITKNNITSNLKRNLYLQRRTSSSAFTTIEELPTSITSYTATNLDPTLEYTFRLVTKSNMVSNQVTFQNLQKFDEVQTINIPENSFSSKRMNIRFSSNDKLLVAANGFFKENNESIAVVYDLENKVKLYEDNPFSGPVVGADIFEQNNLIALVSLKDESLKVINYLTNSIIFETTVSHVYDIEFSPDGDYVYTAGTRGELSKFDLASEKRIFETRAIGPTHSLRSVSVSPTGDSIAISTDGDYTLYSSAGKEIPFQPPVSLGRTSQIVTFSSGGHYISSIRDFDQAAIQRASDGQILYSQLGKFIDVSEHSNRVITSRYAYNNLNGVRYTELAYLSLDNFQEITTMILPKETLGLRYSNENSFFAVATTEGISIMEISGNSTWHLK